MADPLIASAFVKIKPDPTTVGAFGKDVRTKIEKSFTRPIKIKVEPQLLPFKARIQKELSAAVFTIKVSPVLAPGFKAQVSRLAKEAAAGITIPVKPVVPPGRGTGAAKPGAAAAARGPVLSTALAREAKFQSELTKLTNSRTAATRKLTEAQNAQGSVTDRLKVATSALSKAEQVLEKHLLAQDRIEGSLTVKQQGRLATAIKRAQASVGVAAGLKADLEATIASDAADKKKEATTIALTELEGARLKVLASMAKIETAGALVSGTVAVERAKLSVATAAEAAATTLATSASELHAAAGTAESLAMRDLTASLAAAAIAEREKREEAVKGAIADAKAGDAAQIRAAKQAQLTRGLIATALASVGARGATLAASFQFLAGAAIATGVFKSVQLAAKLEEELNVLGVTAGATAEEMAAVSEKALQLGADVTLPAVSANEAAEAMTELAKAGLTVQESMDAARGTLQLATAAQIDNGTAVNITASALNAFGLAGTQAEHVADLLAGSANEAQGGIAEMGASLSSVASVARQAGLSIEDTVAFLTLLAKNGIQGAEAGTALRVALLRLIAPTKKTKEELEGLGVSVLDSFGNIRPEVFADIARKTNDLGAAQRNAALGTIFGTRAIRAQAVLGREGAVGLENMRDATNQLGLANELASARTQGFSGQLESVKNTAATTGLNIGQLLIPPLGLLLESLNLNLGVINKVITALRDLGNAVPDFELTVPGTDFDFSAANPGAEVGLFLDRLTAGIPVVNAFFDPVTRQSEEAKRALELLDEAFQSLAGNAIPLASDIQAAFSAGGESGAVEFVRNLKEQIDETTPQGQLLLGFLQAIERSLTALHRAPTDLELKVLLETGAIPDELAKIQGRFASGPPLEIKAGFAKDSVVNLEHAAEVAAEKAASRARTRFGTIFGQELADSAPGRAVWDPFFFGAEDAAKKSGEKAAEGFSTSFSTFLAAQEASGASDAQRLSDLRGLLPGAERRFRRAQAQQRANPTEAHEKFLAFAAQRLNEIRSEIKSITDEQARTAKEGADDIAKARNEADQNFLDALGLSRGRAENAILRAEGTEGLADDIKTHTFFRNLLVRKRDEAAKTLTDAKTRAETVQALTSDIITENQKIAELNRELITSITDIGEKFETRIEIASFTGGIKKLRKLYSEWIDELQKALGEAKKGSKIAKEIQLTILQTQQAAFDAINEGFELDISIAEAQERPGAEIKARQRFIEQLKREREQFKKGTLEYKRLTLEIINQQKAIEEAGGALKDRNDAFAQMSFEFLTTMQGFSANVMGNLLPLGAIGGTVAGKLAAAGGSSGDPLGGGTGRFQGRPGMGGDNTWPPGAAGGVGGKGAGGGPAAFLGESGRQSDAASAGGFTPSQAATLIALTRQIVILLGGMDKKAKHPESKRKQLAGSSSYDTQ